MLLKIDHKKLFLYTINHEKPSRKYLKNTMKFYEQILAFLFNLSTIPRLPDGVGIMNPFLAEEVRSVCQQFYKKYYNDHLVRKMIIGINPGRFGAGLTGIPFTDPIRLEKICGIINPFDKKQELSSVFIYQMIASFGGPEEFYSRFYITSVSPLGFLANGKNLNYYDRKDLQEGLSPFIIKTLKEQLDFGISKETAFCLGEGKNFKFLKTLNQKQGFFKEVIPLSHPRFIMQYRFKKREEYIDKYLAAFKTN